MSDDDEGDYNTIRHTRSGRGVKLLYTKSKAYIHPTPSSKDNIAGFIALIEQKSPATSADYRPSTSSSADPSSKHEASLASILLAWVPESSLASDAYDTYVKVDLTETSSPPKQTFLVPAPPLTTTSGHGIAERGSGYAFSVPVSEIYSLLIRPPSIGWWYGSVVINTRAGDSFPAIFFHDDECKSTMLQRKKLAKESFDPFKDGQGMFWGGDEVLRWLKRYCTVERTGADPNIYLVDPTEADKQGFGKSPGDKDKRRGPNEPGSTAATGSTSAAGGGGDAGMDPLTKFVKETRWNILEKLSQVTNFTRRTAQAVAENRNLPPQLRRMVQNPDVQQLQNDFDSARIYLARWAMGIAEQSEREQNRRVFTAQDVLEHESTEVGDFELLEIDTAKLSLSDDRKPVDIKEWNAWFNADSGRLEITPDEVKKRIFMGGLNPDDGVRKEAWLFLLGVYDWDSSKEERKAVMNSRRDEYIRLKGTWWERQIDGSMNEEESEWWREQKTRIEKDVHRTDRNVTIFAGEDIPHPDPDSPFADQGTNVHLEQMKDMLLTYNEFNKELGYVQGMSDLLAPIYAVMQDDAVAFWAFENFMERMERNFLRDQSGMRNQLLTLDHLVQLVDPQLYLHLQSADSTNFFFFFRMLLVWFKREFEFTDVLRLWEVLWTDHLSGEHQLFIALAILEKHRDVIMTHLKHFDEVLKYINELSGAIDLPSTLIHAERLFGRFERIVEAVDRKKTFPAPQGAQVKQQSSEAEAPSSPKPQSSPAGNRPAGRQAVVSPRPGQQATPQTQTGKKEKVISPELRRLLKRDPPRMGREEVRKHGGGVG